MKDDGRKVRVSSAADPSLSAATGEAALDRFAAPSSSVVLKQAAAVHAKRVLARYDLSDAVLPESVRQSLRELN